MDKKIIQTNEHNNINNNSNIKHKPLFNPYISIIILLFVILLSKKSVPITLIFFAIFYIFLISYVISN
jgi:hypothetical protein